MTAKISHALHQFESMSLKSDQEKKIQTAIDLLQPCRMGSFQPEDDFSVARLTVPAKTFYKKGKMIQKLSFWVNLEGYKAVSDQDVNTPKCRFILHYADSTKEAFSFPLIYPVPAGISFIVTLFKNLADAGALIDNAFFSQSNRNIQNWTEFLADRTNNHKETELYYNTSRTKVAERFVTKLECSPSLFAKAEKGGLQLFSFGCGNGDDVAAVRRGLIEQLKLYPETFGSDINPSNFVNELEGVTLEKADFETLDSYLPTRLRQDTLKLGLFMGSLTYMVSKTSYTALQTLHAVKDFDILIVGGYTPILLNPRIFKAAGWIVELEQTNHMFDKTPSSRFPFNTDKGTIQTDCRSLFTLVAMTDDERKSYLEKRGTKRSSASQFDCLDLSCSSHPLRDLSLFTDLTGMKQVDISWSSLSQIEFAEFITKLEKSIEKPVFLIASGDEPWFSHFSEITSEKFKLKVRADHRQNELAPFAPATAKRIGSFDRLPTKEIP